MAQELGRSESYFPNGSKVVSVTVGTLGTPGEAPSDVVTTTTVTTGPGGELPPGYPDAWPGATLVQGS